MPFVGDKMIEFIDNIAKQNMNGLRPEAIFEFEMYVESIKHDKAALEKLKTAYFQPQGKRPAFHKSSNMLNITFLLLKNYEVSFSDFILMNLLSDNPLDFSVSQLMLIKNHIFNFLPQLSSLTSPDRHDADQSHESGPV